MDIDMDVTAFLTKQKQAVPDQLKEFYSTFQDYYDKK